MSQNPRADRSDAPAASTEESPVETLRARIDVLRAENERLRTEYARTKQTQYRRTAIGLAGLGSLAILAAVLFSSVRTTLLIIGATGVFGGILTYYLTPEQFVAATVGEHLYDSVASNYEAIAADLGLSDVHVYVPRTETPSSTRLFVPVSPESQLPPADALDTPFVVTDDAKEWGLALQPIGTELFAEFEQSMAGPLAEDIEQAGTQLADGLNQQFEIVDSADVSVSDGQLTVALQTSVYGALERFDHPVVSFLAVGIAQAHSVPVVADVAEGDDRYDSIVTVRLMEETESLTEPSQ